MHQGARALSWVSCVALLALAAPTLYGQKDDGKPAKIVIKCYDDAEITVNGKATKLSGAERIFDTPPLKADAKTKYYYEIVVVWQPNNYETYTRKRKVYVTPGETVSIDMLTKDPKNPDDIKIRYVPTPDEFVEEMMKLAKVGKDDVVYDLGCGDGRLVVAAVSKYGAKRGVGVDIDPERLKECKENAKKAKVEDKLEFRKEDVMKMADLGKATVVTLYLSDGLNEQLWPILQKNCKPGTRIVSHRFLMGKNKPEKSVPVKSEDGYEESVHLWTVGGAKPAKDKEKETKDKKDKEEKKDKDGD